MPIQVRHLQVGMYVVDLDRPWEETPFHFQGFEILSSSEIELLARYCKRVYVDTNYVSASSNARRKLDASARMKSLSDEHVTTQIFNTQRFRLRTGITTSTPYEYPQPVKLRQEAKLAIEAFAEARRKCTKLHDALRAGKPVTARHCRGAVADIARSVMRNPDALAWQTFLQKSQPQPNDRSISSAVWCAILCRYLELSPNLLLDVTSGALLMDIGMTKIATTLKTQRGEFERRQHLAVRSHVQIGQDMLTSVEGISAQVLEMQAQHHERFDGSGYPLGLRAAGISAVGAIAAVIDSYDAMISDTGRRPAMSSGDAISELQRLAGSQLSELVVEQFVQAIGTFPSGSLVELNTGEVAIVAEQVPRHRLRPHLLVVRDSEKREIASPKPLQLSTVTRDAGKRGAVWIIHGLPSGSFGIDTADYFR